ncbi:MAG: hypothetical protein KKF44_00420 [Nanoarchaeota archaeon]|nr:hypothetical protein [Nanoarchaeota archaeon]
MKPIYLLAILLVLASCTTGKGNDANTAPEAVADNTENEIITNEMPTIEEPETDEMVETVKIETEEVIVETDGKNTEVTLDTDNNPVVEEYCIPGSTYAYSSDEGSVDSLVIGLEMYEGKEFCKATSDSVIASPIGEIKTTTVYYFNNDQSEFWIDTTTDTGMGPAQSNKIHIVDGEPV